ncbi:MAG: RloB family protein [Candidatus Sumerlaeia bacterium]|nr:RloB family protein [Candidatus Sumerlaeia bacterium]
MKNKHKQLGRERFQRKIDTDLSKRIYILIVAGGEKTEVNYLRDMKIDLELSSTIVKIESSSRDPLSILKKAIELRNKKYDFRIPYDHTWIVFDKDDFTSFDQTINRANSENIRCAWSNECFELWYLLHYDYVNTTTPRGDFAEKITENIGKPYRKNSTEMYELLKPHYRNAVKNAVRLRLDLKNHDKTPSQQNPCTTVDKLTEFLYCLSRK